MSLDLCPASFATVQSCSVTSHVCIVQASSQSSTSVHVTFQHSKGHVLKSEFSVKLEQFGKIIAHFAFEMTSSEKVLDHCLSSIWFTFLIYCVTYFFSPSSPPLFFSSRGLWNEPVIIYRDQQQGNTKQRSQSLAQTYFWPLRWSLVFFFLCLLISLID